MIADINNIIIPVLFFGIPIIGVFTIFYVLKNESWKSTNKILANLNKSDFEIFKDVQIQVSSYSKFKIITGFPLKGTFYINKLSMIIMGDNKPNFFTYNTTLPLVIYNSNFKEQFDIKLCNWKAIILTSRSDNSVLSVKKEILIEPKDTHDFERLKELIFNWC
jgi:hypothetical protein